MANSASLSRSSSAGSADTDLADEQRLAGLGNRSVDRPLGGFVGFRHQIDRLRLLTHQALVETAETRQDFCLGRIAQDVGKQGNVEGGHGGVRGRSREPLD